MDRTNAYEGVYHDESAVYLRAGAYEAVMLPGIGGNLISFRDLEKGYRFLHEPAPEEMAAFRERPMIHGIPVLFPPNRYEQGNFRWNGKIHHLPVNEEATGHHLHGFLYNIPWELDDYGHSKQEAYVTVSVHVDERHPVYEAFPFPFHIQLRYSLSDQGLSQRVTITNTGTASMPCLLAFHTSINAPFVEGGDARDYRMKLTLGKRWELGESMLPTGAHQPLSASEEAMQGDGVYPFFERMDNHYTAAAQNGRNRMELTDEAAQLTLVYDVGTSYKQWMIWNNEATEGFLCPEPQINLVNAPNMDMPAEEVGCFSLEPDEIWEETSRLYVKKS
ncbi:aldose 1-epimerase [Paenibacillus glucanolyticus]|uniref:aldose 1-epimerase n=1 Tax=Paenibacillus glucanolyticus TaxID=59843 RepID=UPI00096F72E8|nr:aldose 1-epimerase [Paenibacillus glucanolyticus]MPY16702.1 aldose 1-epimerase [Paenibacillus glucanolyticus]OMF74519.1 aldose epimerase [Paenibacillus glucanolyticus]